MAVFQDNFDDNSISAANWTATNSADVTVSEVSQQLKFATDAAYSGSQNIGFLTSTHNYVFTDKQVEIDIVSVIGGTAGQTAGCSIKIYDSANSNNYAAIFVDQNSIIYRRSNNGVNSQSSAAWSTTYTKWRLKHQSSDNTWLFYTYTTGTWTLRFTSAAANWNPTAAKIYLEGYTYGSTGSTLKNFIVDNLITDADDPSILDVTAGSLSLTGQSVDLNYGDRILVVNEGALTLTGQSVNLIYGRKLTVNEGTLSLTGQNVDLTSTFPLTVNPGSLALTGQSVALKLGYKLTVVPGELTLRGESFSLEATQEETFILNLLVDLLPLQSSDYYQRFSQKLSVDGDELPVRSWQYEESDQNLVGKLSVELANVDDRSLIDDTKEIVFQASRLAVGETWDDTNPTSLINTGKVQRKDYTLSKQGIGQADTFTFIGLNETDSRLNKTFSNNTVYYDSTYHTVSQDDFEGLYDEGGNYTPPDVVAFTGMSLHGLLNAVLVGLCGFVRIVPQIPNFPLHLVEFQAGKSVTQVFNGIMGVFEADYDLVGDTLYIRSGIDGTPSGFPAPVQVTVRESSALGVATEYTQVDGLMLSVNQEKFIYDYFDDRIVISNSDTGSLGFYPGNKVTTTTTTTYRDYYRLSRARPVLTVIKEITKSEHMTFVGIIKESTETFTYDSFARVAYRTKEMYARVPDASDSFSFNLIRVSNEDEVFQYRVHPYMPRTYYLKYREINKTGLVFIDGDNQQLGEDYIMDVVRVTHAGNVVDTMTSDWRKIETFSERTTPQRNKKVKIDTVEVNFLTNQYTIDDTEERDGEVGVNIFVQEQQKIRIGSATGLTEDVNMGEMPLDLALATGYKILENRQSLPNRVSLTVIGLRFDLTKGTPINAIGRQGEDLGNYIIEARTLSCSAKQTDGTGKVYLTTLQCRQAE